MITEGDAWSPCVTDYLHQKSREGEDLDLPEVLPSRELELGVRG
jgi:hypothetical protein